MNYNRGFIALMSSLIISTILLVVVVAGSVSGFTTRFNMLDAEAKQQSAALADGCVDLLLFQLGEDSGYAGSPPISRPMGGGTCTVNASGVAGVFAVQGVYQHSYTNLEVVVDTGTLDITSWQEVAN
ncbi:MAG: hypothetical protein V4436_03520 [Patescibacteria group bacterium]